MSKAVIYFSDNSTLTLHDGDVIIPIVIAHPNGEEPFASMAPPQTLESHIHDGLHPSLLTALCECDFFYVTTNNNIVYNKNAIVKIETI